MKARILIVLGWFIGWLLLTRVRHLPKREVSKGSGDDGPVTIVIPARNEASSLPNLLGDLAEARPTGARVIVVNDGSEDDTAKIARSFDFVEVIDASELRDGWLGKTWACHTGAAAVETGTIVFLDADVRLHGDAIARAVALRAERGGLLTIWPYHEVEKPYEHLSSLFNVTAMMVTGAASLFPPRKPKAGFGPFMVTVKDDYEQVGGHTSVKSSVIEDFALTRRYSDAGFPVTNLGGGRDVTFRMYPDGFGSLVDGWTKNFGPGVWNLPVIRLLFVMVWVGCAYGPVKWGGGMEVHTILQVMYGLYVIQMFVMFRWMGRFSVLCALFYPLLILLLWFVLARSLWRIHVRGSVTWRGRKVPTRSSS